MAQGDTYYTILHGYLYNDTTKEMLSDLGDFPFFIPYIPATNPGTGRLYDNHFVTSLMTAWEEITDIHFLSSFGFLTTAQANTAMQLVFQSLFPNMKILGDSSPKGDTCLIVVNTSNGKAFRHRGTSSTRSIHDNLSDAINGVNIVYSISVQSIDGIGSGTTYSIGYNNILTVDNADYIQTFALVSFTNLASNNVNGYFNLSTVQYTNGSWTENADLSYFFGSITPVPVTPSDPYSGGGTTDTGGGTGTFSDTSTPIDFPALPSVSAVDAGFIKLYNPTLAQLNSLAAYMWTGLDLTAFKKIFADPMECILGLSLVPVAVPDGSTEEIFVGNIGTGVSMTKANSQYVEVDCGTLEVKEFWGAYLDFSPYTKLELYLPYIGIHQVDADEIVGKTIHIKYHVDILTGACIAYVKCGDSVLYSFNGQCSANVPLTSRDWTNTLNGIISIAGSIGSLVASGGANAPSAISNIASSAMNAVKPTIEKSGSLSGVGGMMGIQTPYLILTRPKQALPEGQNTFSGYPSFITVTLSEITGYAEIESIHLENVPCTGAELSEIEAILKEGVIL